MYKDALGALQFCAETIDTEGTVRLSLLREMVSQRGVAVLEDAP